LQILLKLVITAKPTRSPNVSLNIEPYYKITSL
jgi:hypothetical protein